MMGAGETCKVGGCHNDTRYYFFRKPENSKESGRVLLFCSTHGAKGMLGYAWTEVSKEDYDCLSVLEK